MNRKMLRTMQHFRVRLRPIPFEQARRVDDYWRVEIAKDQPMEIVNMRTDHRLKLRQDRIHDFQQDDPPLRDGYPYGILTLHCQVYLSGDRVVIEPLPSRSCSTRP